MDYLWIWWSFSQYGPFCHQIDSNNHINRLTSWFGSTVQFKHRVISNYAKIIELCIQKLNWRENPFQMKYAKSVEAIFIEQFFFSYSILYIEMIRKTTVFLKLQRQFAINHKKAKVIFTKCSNESITIIWLIFMVTIFFSRLFILFQMNLNCSRCINGDLFNKCKWNFHCRNYQFAY